MVLSMIKIAISIAIMTFLNNQTAGSVFLFGLQLSIYRNIIKMIFYIAFKQHILTS